MKKQLFTAASALLRLAVAASLTSCASNEKACKHLGGVYAAPGLCQNMQREKIK